MSRVAKRPISIPKDIKIELNKQLISIQGKYGYLSRTIHHSVKIKYLNNIITFEARLGFSDGWAQAGTSRSIVCSMIIGVSEKFIKKLQFSGVGYRVSITKNNIINMSLGYSHPILYSLPPDIEVECLSPTELVIKGVDKQLVGQVAANLRSYRKPEPYKGKGIRYSDEIVRIKEAKKSKMIVSKNSKINSRMRRLKKSRYQMKSLGATRLIVHRTSRHIYAQIISPESKVLVFASTLEKKIKCDLKYTGNKNSAEIIGKIIAKRALFKGISDVSFDRSGFKYHGRIKVLADSARNFGLKF